MAGPVELALAGPGIQIETTRIPAAAAKQTSIPICAQFRAFTFWVLAVSRSMFVSGYPQPASSAVVETFITSKTWLVQLSIKIALIHKT
jgi:hypothetical protein